MTTEKHSTGYEEDTGYICIFSHYNALLTVLRGLEVFAQDSAAALCQRVR